MLHSVTEHLIDDNHDSGRRRGAPWGGLRDGDYFFLLAFSSISIAFTPMRSVSSHASK